MEEAIGPTRVLSRTADRLAAIAEAAEAFHEAVFDLDVLLHIVAERISLATGDFCSVLLLSPDGRRIEPLVAYHPDPKVLQDARQFLGISMDIEAAGPWARVLTERQSVIIAVDPDHLPPGMTPHQARHIRRWRVREAALIPLITRNTVVGGLNLNRLEGSPPFTPDDIDLLESLGARAARAIANARLLQAEKQTAGALEGQVQARTREAEARALEARAAVARLQAVLISPLSTVVIATDPLGLITLFNSGAEQLLGYTAKEVVGTATPTLFISSIEIEAKATALGVEPAFAALALEYSTSGASEEWVLITRTGGERPVELSISPTLGADESRLGFVVIARDISERKALEADLKAALAEGREVVAPAVARRDEVAELARSLAAWERFSRQRLEGSQAMAELSSLTEVEDVIRVGLQRMGATFGASQGFVALAETNGARVAAALHPDEAPTALRVGALLDPRTPGIGALAWAAPVPVEFDAGIWSEALASLAPEFGTGPLMALPLVSGARVAGIVTLIRGRTDEPFSAAEVELAATMSAPLAAALVVSRLVAELRQSNARLIEANLHKSQFLGNMSHELRTPLTAILGFSELLLDDDESRFTRVAKRGFLEHIHAGGQHLLDLINDILDLSKVEAGQMKLRLETVSVAKAVDEVVSTVGPLVAKKHLKVETNASSAGTLVADAGKLTQMLLNLLSNAIKFTPEGGIITIAGRRMPETMEISITDSGIGISQADLRRIFQEFLQLDSGIGRLSQGTGLGLALTRRYAALHGGGVRVTSEVGVGSVFTLTLPLAGPDIEKDRAADPIRSADATALDDRPLILVVEDDPAVAELVTHIAEGGGFRTEIARTGTEALAKARELRPVAITLDIVLPELDGWEVLERLKHDEATSAIPVAVVSVLDNPERGVALGALDYFVKPVRADELLRRLTRFNIKRTAGREEVRVLVVDDEAANRDLLAGVLEPAGFKVILAAGGLDGIRLARSGRPDLILLDLLMPDVSGFDVVEALHSEEATQAIPIMVLTAKEMTEADKLQLNGHVSAILSRGSTGAADLLGQLRQIVAAQSVDKSGNHP